MTEKPNPTRGMHHVALNVIDLKGCEYFYVDLLGMQVEWRPDENSVYLCSGNDNLALHKIHSPDQFQAIQHLDHIGFILKSMDDVDRWYDYLLSHDIEMKTKPRTHRDGARSFYCYDPDGNVVQMIHHPPLAHL